MKKFSFLLMTSAILFCACSSESEPFEPTNERTVPVRFYLELQPDVVPFNTRVMPDGLPVEPTVVEEPPVSEPDPDPAVEPTKSTFSFIEYVVFDEEEHIIKHQQLKNDDENATGMIVADEFSPGVYQICFFAHSTSDVQLEGSNLTFPDKVSECFYTFENFEVEIGNDIEEDFTLKRIVSRVEFKSKDDVPENIASFKVETSGIYKTFDLLHGYATEETSAFTLTRTFTDEDRLPGKAPVHAFYTFVPREESTGGLSEATLKALDKEGKVVREKEVLNIPIYTNCITRYLGILYTNASDASFNLDINTDWGKVVSVELDDD